VADVEPGSVRFATICDDEHGFTRSFLLSFLPMLAVDFFGEQRILRGGYSIQGATSSGVVEGRNEVVREFLGSSAEWLFFIDSDMGFDHDALERLIDAADPVDRPIVGGLCFGFGPVKDTLGPANATIKHPFPVIFDLKETDDDMLFAARWGYVPNQLTRCAATGAALLLIHRSVFEAMAAKWGPGCWFNRMKNPKGEKLWGEDTSFCMRANLLDIPVHVHTGVQTSHSKVVMVTQDVYMQAVTAPPATAEVAVIVPVLRRPQNAEPFMRSLRASTGLAKVYAVANIDDEDTVKAWSAAGVDKVIFTDGVSFAKKVNAGYQATTEPWVFIVGDDVKFHPGWLDHAQHVAAMTEAKVIGTNDLGNARVMAGDHATHMLISRAYLDEHGGSWDGPKVVCHEGYRHWFVDDEIVTAAKQRGVFTVALASVVEHLHPAWDKGTDDPVYQFGQMHANQDMKLFRKRLAEYAA
jgi:GT2 family glycosyltransferase